MLSCRCKHSVNKPIASLVQSPERNVRKHFLVYCCLNVLSIVSDGKTGMVLNDRSKFMFAKHVVALVACHTDTRVV